ncbi:MAG: hypothetical protein H5T83_11085, partial [Actinotalea sp.]|nr:hypothetical protein [Actinotalea sp.]
QPDRHYHRFGGKHPADFLSDNTRGGQPHAQPAIHFGHRHLRKAFGWFVLVMGAFILVQEAPADWRLPAVGALAALVAAGGAWVLLRRRRGDAPATG